MTDANPALTEYTNFRDYIRDWVRARKGRSYQSLANQVGCSKSQVYSIVSGKRALTPHWRHSFTRALGLQSKRERDYFCALIDLEQSPELPRRRKALRHILSTQSFDSANATDRPLHRLYSRWYYLAVAELAGCTGFQEDPAWIAATLRPAVTATQATEALALLEDIGLLVREDGALQLNGTWSSGHGIDDPLLSTAATDLHLELLGLAEQAIKRVPHARRQVEFVTFGMPSSQLEEYRELIRRFQEELVHLAASTRHNDQVYTVSVQLFPVSAPTTER